MTRQKTQQEGMNARVLTSNLKVFDKWVKQSKNPLAARATLTRFLEVAGEDYVVRPEHAEVIIRCLRVLYQGDRGIVLAGPVGVGKSRLMRILQEFTRGTGKYFHIVDTQSLNNAYLQSGEEVITNYAFAVDSRGGDYRYCFDDLGEEGEVMHYGTRARVMEQVIQALYQRYSRDGVVSHYTTNIKAGKPGADQSEPTIYNLYGERVYDRLKEMTEWIPLTGESFRKAK